MRYTLLSLTQDILSSMDSDEVNSITDTVESKSVVNCIKSAYDQIVSRLEIGRRQTLFNLDPSNDLTFPTLMYKPDNITDIDWLKYESREQEDDPPAWRELTWLKPLDFFEYTYSFNTQDSNVTTATLTLSGNAIMLVFKNDTAPKFYCSFDDDAILFDAYNSALDDTLKASKSLGYGEIGGDWIEEDTFDFPLLQPNHFALLFNEAKAMAWAELKQMENPKAQEFARDNWVRIQKLRKEVPNNLIYWGPDFGKRTRFSNFPFKRAVY